MSATNNIWQGLRVRLAQRAFGKAFWEQVLGDLSDADLAANGFKLGGPGRDLSGLSPEEAEELRRLWATPRWKVEEDGLLDREEELASKAPFYLHVPPLDVDVNEQSPEYEESSAKKEALRIARVLDEELPRNGMGKPSWHRTNDRGSLHGDQRVPREVVSVNLLLAIGWKVRRIARAHGVPLLTECPKDKTKRPAVVLDDSLFNRHAEGRGVMWRLVGAMKPGKAPKRPHDIHLDTPIDSAAEPSPWERAVLEKAIRDYEQEEADKAAERKRRAEAAARSGPVIHDDDEINRRVRAYLRKCQPAISGENGRSATWKVVCEVVRGFDRDDETAYRFLSEWNQTCVPPWTENELRGKIRDVRSKADQVLGSKLHSNWTPKYKSRPVQIDPIPPDTYDHPCNTPPREDDDRHFRDDHPESECPRGHGGGGHHGKPKKRKSPDISEEMRVTLDAPYLLETDLPDYMTSSHDHKVNARSHRVAMCRRNTCWSDCEDCGPKSSFAEPCDNHVLCKNCPDYYSRYLLADFIERKWPDRVFVVKIPLEKPGDPAFARLEFKRLRKHIKKHGGTVVQPRLLKGYDHVLAFFLERYKDYALEAFPPTPECPSNLLDKGKAAAAFADTYCSINHELWEQIGSSKHGSRVVLENFPWFLTRKEKRTTAAGAASDELPFMNISDFREEAKRLRKEKLPNLKAGCCDTIKGYDREGNPVFCSKRLYNTFTFDFTGEQICPRSKEYLKREDLDGHLIESGIEKRWVDKHTSFSAAPLFEVASAVASP